MRVNLHSSTVTQEQFEGKPSYSRPLAVSPRFFCGSGIGYKIDRYKTGKCPRLTGIRQKSTCTRYQTWIVTNVVPAEQKRDAGRALNRQAHGRMTLAGESNAAFALFLGSQRFNYCKPAVDMVMFVCDGAVFPMRVTGGLHEGHTAGFAFL
jgi:hypothetical protein